MASAPIRTICPYCAVGCPILLSVEGGRVRGIDYDPESPVNEGALCAKGNAAAEILNHPDRVKNPMRRVGDRWESISWEEAFEIAGEHLTRIRDRHGPQALGFLASAKATNEENYLFQKLARLLGTHNVDHCARLCHASTLAGLGPALGAAAMTNPLADLAHSRCILVLGANPAENHPVACRWILKAREKGATVIVVDPRRTPTAWMADRHLPIRPGTDAAFLNALARIIVRERLWDQTFVSERTRGFPSLRHSLDDVSPEAASTATGIPVRDMEETARAFAVSKASAIVYCMGITQHVSGTRNVSACANLALLCGQVGRPGTGLYPVRGQDNVQGACDMGALAGFYPGYRNVADGDVRRTLADLWGIHPQRLPLREGLTVVEMEHAALEGKLQGLAAMGENPLVTSPNSAKTASSLRRLEFFMVQDIFLTETARLAHLLLPAAAWAERSGSKTASDRRVQWSFAAVDPPGDARPDWWIICRLAEILGLGDHFPHGKPEDILHEINRTVPAYGGITPERLKTSTQGIPWPCPHPGHPGTPILHRDRFATPDGRAVFVAVRYLPPPEPASPEFPLILTTGRTALHYNSGSMTRRTPSLTDREPDVFVEVHPDDAEALGMSEGERVAVATVRGTIDARLRLSERMKPGVVFLPFHFPETNRLTLDALDPQAKIPEYKASACRLQRIGDNP